jgi:hypothetical protein
MTAQAHSSACHAARIPVAMKDLAKGPENHAWALEAAMSQRRVSSGYRRGFGGRTRSSIPSSWTSKT